MDKNTSMRPMIRDDVMSQVGGLPTTPSISPEEAKRQSFLQRMMRFFTKGQRVTVTSKYANAYIRPDLERALAKKETRRKMANASRKNNRKTKGRTALHHRKGS